MSVCIYLRCRHLGRYHRPSRWSSQKSRTRIICEVNDAGGKVRWPTRSGEADTFEHHVPRCRALNAILLTAGYGTRIRSLFPDTPKALIEVGGRPLVDHLLANLARSGLVESAMVVTNDRYHDALWRHLAAAARHCPPA